jgi:hypothetical protein
MSLLGECGFCMKQSLLLVKSIIATCEQQYKLKYIKYYAKLHMQYCAVLSQQNKHTEALDHAKYGVRYIHRGLQETVKIAEHYASKNSVQTTLDTRYSTSINKKQASDNSFMQDLTTSLNNHNSDSTTIIELVATKILPVLYELIKRFVDLHDEPNNENFNSEPKPKISNSAIKKPNLNLQHLTGVLHCSDFVAMMNIGNIMQLTPMSIQDVMSNYDKEVELTREAMTEKVALLAAAYFCISTEKRFLQTSKLGKAATVDRQSEFWHAKALEIACCFLPPD